MQITTDLMVKYGVGKMAKPPKATEWVKLDLLADAKKQLNIDSRRRSHQEDGSCQKGEEGMERYKHAASGILVPLGVPWASGSCCPPRAG